MFKSDREWIRIPINEAVLIRASGGVLGWYGSRFDVAAIVGVLLLARFRGRGQSVIGALSFILLALVPAIAGARLQFAPRQPCPSRRRSMRDLAVRASGLRQQAGCLPYLRERLATLLKLFPAGCGSQGVTKLWSS